MAPQIDLIANMITKMQQDVQLVPKWIQELIEAKDKLFAFIEEMKEKFEQVKREIDVLRPDKLLHS